MEARRLSFGSAADLYDRVRPSYPADAGRWALGSEHCNIADLGAGTGIFTRLLAALGHQVVAVEPDAEMRAKLAERSPAIDVVAGSAESIPLPAQSLDAVTAAQSHHWFDTDDAHGEIARVLRPNGMFVAVWNVRDESVAWVAEMSELVGLEDGSRTHQEDAATFGALFTEPERREFSHSTTHDAESLLGLLHSRSYYLVASEEEKRRIDEAVPALASRLPERFGLPYITRVVRAKTHLAPRRQDT